MKDRVRVIMDQAPMECINIEPQIGDVYPMKGGRSYNTRFMVILGIRQNMAYYLSFDSDGEVTGADCLSTNNLERRQRLGRLIDLPEFRINWGC